MDKKTSNLVPGIGVLREEQAKISALKEAEWQRINADVAALKCETQSLRAYLDLLEYNIERMRGKVQQPE